MSSSSEIDAAFFDKKFSVTRHLLRYVVGASSDDVRHEQLQRVTRQREVADREIAGVIDENFANFNTSLARFASISGQLEGVYTKQISAWRFIELVQGSNPTLGRARDARKDRGGRQALDRREEHPELQDQEPP